MLPFRFPYATLPPLSSACRLGHPHPVRHRRLCPFLRRQTWRMHRYRSRQAVPSALSTDAVSWVHACDNSSLMLWTPRDNPSLNRQSWRTPYPAALARVLSIVYCSAVYWADCCFWDLLRFSFFAAKIISDRNIRLLWWHFCKQPKITEFKHLPSLPQEDAPALK